MKFVSIVSDIPNQGEDGGYAVRCVVQTRAWMVRWGEGIGVIL